MPELENLSHACLHDTHTGTELRTCKDPGCSCMCHPMTTPGGDVVSDAADAALSAIRKRQATLAAADWSDPDYGPAAMETAAYEDVPRLLAAVDAVLALHQEGPYSLRGALCREHDNYRHFSITSDEASDEASRVAACTDCQVTVKRMCSCRDAEWPCANRRAITRALTGEDAPS
jgi:hypothetical protein